MKRRYLDKTIIFSMCLVLGILLPIQIRQNPEENIIVSLNSIQAMENEINNTQTEIADIKELIEKKNEEIKNIQSALIEGNISEILEEEIEEVKAIAGFEDLQGPGIIVSIADNDDKYIVGGNALEDIIHDSDVLNIINDLKVAGAEAISIKGQRVMSTSEIQCGGPIIWINKNSVTNPFVIKAIGDPKALYAAINAPDQTGYILKNLYKLEVKTEISDNVLIPKFLGELQINHIKPIEEGE